MWIATEILSQQLKEKEKEKVMIENLSRKSCPKCEGTTLIAFVLHPGTAYMQHDEVDCKFRGPEVKVLNGMEESDIERRAVEAWNDLPRNIS